MIKEGEKERVQLFTGTVLAFHGHGISRTVKIRRIVAGEGVERTFALHSSRVADVTVKGRGIIRRAKLYFLREREGKKTRLTRNLGRLKWPRSGAGSGLTQAETSADAPTAE